MMEKKQSPDKNASGSNDLSSSSISRVGAVLAAIGTLFGEGCAGGPQTAVKSPVPRVAQANDLSSVVKKAEGLGIDHLVYFDARNSGTACFRNAQRLSLNYPDTNNQSGSMIGDAAVKHNQEIRRFNWKAFETWKEARLTELKNRPDVQEALMYPGSGIILSISDGRVFKTFVADGSLQFKELTAAKGIGFPELSTKP